MGNAPRKELREPRLWFESYYQCQIRRPDKTIQGTPYEVQLQTEVSKPSTWVYYLPILPCGCQMLLAREFSMGTKEDDWRKLKNHSKCCVHQGQEWSIRFLFRWRYFEASMQQVLPGILVPIISQYLLGEAGPLVSFSSSLLPTLSQEGESMLLQWLEAFYAREVQVTLVTKDGKRKILDFVAFEGNLMPIKCLAPDGKSLVDSLLLCLEVLHFSSNVKTLFDTSARSPWTSGISLPAGVCSQKLGTHGLVTAFCLGCPLGVHPVRKYMLGKECTTTRIKCGLALPKSSAQNPQNLEKYYWD